MRRRRTVVTMVSTRGIVWSEVAAGDRPTVRTTPGVSTQKMVSKMHTPKVHSRSRSNFVTEAAISKVQGTDFTLHEPPL